MHPPQEGPLNAGALRADIANFIGSRSTMYRTAEALDKAGVMSRNEIADMMAQVSSRPTILDYLRTRRAVTAVTEDLRTAGLDGTFGVSGPGPHRPQANPLTLAMSVSPSDVEDQAAVFARLRKTLAKKHQLKIAAPPGAQPEPAEDLGMPADSSPGELLLAAGEFAHLVPIGPKRPRQGGKGRLAPPLPPRASAFARPRDLPIEDARRMP